MRVATVLILSGVSVFGYACTGEGSADHGSGGSAGESGGTPAKGGAGGNGSVAGKGGSQIGGAAGLGDGGRGGEGGDAGVGGMTEGGAGAGPVGGAAGASGGNGGQGGTSEPPNVLVFSRTLGFRHDSIVDGIDALETLARGRGWQLTATEESNAFSDAGLAAFHVVVFLSTTGDVLDTDGEGALERFVRAGGGWVGIHSASDTEYSWPFYAGLVGAFFREHPSALQPALVRVENPSHPATASLPTEWRRTDEWYAFATNPRPNVTVLLTLDESSYMPGTATMGSDHPVAWYHAYEGGRAFYTALGHTRESYAEPSFVAHLAGAIEWAAGR